MQGAGDHINRRMAKCGKDEEFIREMLGNMIIQDLTMCIKDRWPDGIRDRGLPESTVFIVSSNLMG